jgi:hypothetical protein
VVVGDGGDGRGREQFLDDGEAAAGVGEALFGFGDRERRVVVVVAMLLGEVTGHTFEGDLDGGAFIAADAPEFTEEGGDALGEGDLEGADRREGVDDTGLKLRPGVRATRRG